MNETTLQTQETLDLADKLCALGFDHPGQAAEGWKLIAAVVQTNPNGKSAREIYTSAVQWHSRKMKVASNTAQTNIARLKAVRWESKGVLKLQAIGHQKRDNMFVKMVSDAMEKEIKKIKVKK